MAEREVRQRLRLRAGVIALAVALSFTCSASDARSATRSDTVTLTMLATSNLQPAYDVLIPNFERVYPNIKINVSYGQPGDLTQLESVELAARNAPDLLLTVPGCGTPISICVLAKAGDLAPMVNKPWVRWSLPLITSADKYGQGLFAFTPIVATYGIFTNDDLFKKLGLRVPQTFAQLLDLCQKAKTAGTVALLWAAAPSASPHFLPLVLAVATLYGKDASWAGELRAGTASFDATAGWHEALKHVVDLNTAGCFEPGVTGTTSASSVAQFAQGQSLMFASTSPQKGQIDAANPQFRYSYHPFPGGTDPSQTRTFLRMANSLSVNAHAGTQAQQAAQTFVDFVARPKQDALYALTTGGVTQYQFLHGQIPTFMSDYSAVFKEHKYVIEPDQSWWNANVYLALQQNVVGLLTGQRSIDDVLTAMDAAWKQGPA